MCLHSPHRPELCPSYLAAKDEQLRQILRSHLSRERATRLAGSFGTHHQHYSLTKVKARNRKTEILWIFFGIHTSNAVLMTEKTKTDRLKLRDIKLYSKIEQPMGAPETSCPYGAIWNIQGRKDNENGM